MLTKFHKIMLALLVVQVGLVFFVLSRGDDAVTLTEQPLLAGFDVAKVSRVQVHGTSKDGKPIDLVKRGEAWVLASHFDYPVLATKVTDVLTPIGKMAAAEPVATNKSRHKQLKVADDDFERKLVMSIEGGKDVTLYIGSSAGARKTAVRLGGDDRIYGVTGVTAFAAGTEARQWVDTKYSDVPPAEIAKVTITRPAGLQGGGTVEIMKGPPPGAGSGGSGSGSGSGAGSAGSGAGVPPPEATTDVITATIDGAPLALAAGETIDPDAVQRIISAVASIIGDGPADPKRDASAPNATITIERKATGATSVAPVVLDVIVDGDNYWVHQKGSDKAVLVPKSRLSEVMGVARDKLVKKPEAPGTGSGSAAPQGLPPGLDLPSNIPPHMIPPGMPPGR